MDNKHDLDSPAGYNGGNGPGEALKMPTKHYESAKEMPKGPSKKDIIDSPACKK